MANQDTRDTADAFERFLRRVWRAEVAPKLAGRRRRGRATGARVGGTIAGLGGTLLDRLFGLRGRPFARAGTVLGASVGAILPDVWDWEWLRRASAAQYKAVAGRVREHAARLEDDEALALLGLHAGATAEDVRRAWHAASKRWHPDLAPDGATRREHALRFVTLNAAHERLCDALESGRLPRS